MSLFQYCETGRDSAYIALAGECIDDVVAPEKRERFFYHRSGWFPSECCDEHARAYVR